MRVTKNAYYFIAAVLLLVSFQNCEMQTYQASSVTTLTKQESGNGGGYEGKPEGTYYLYAPNYSCEGVPAAKQVAELINGEAYVYENQTNQCGRQQSRTRASDFDISPFQKEFISVSDLLFKRYEVKPDGIPENLAEVLCRDDFKNPTFEVVSHYDRENNQAVTRAYMNGKEVPDFGVSRLLSMNSVKYVSKNLSFSVDLSRPTQTLRKFQGAIEKSSIPGVNAGPVICVIGGALDTSSWSLKQVGDLEPNGFEVADNGEVLIWSDVSRDYVLKDHYIAFTHIFKLAVDGILSDLSKVLLGNDVDVNYQVSSNSKSLQIYGARKASEIWDSVYVTDLRTGKTKRLTNTIAGKPIEQYSYASPVLTKGNYLFFDTMVLGENMSRTVVMRVYDLDADKIEDVGALDDLCYTYAILPEADRLVKICKDANARQSYLEIYEAASKTFRRVNVDVSTSCSLYPAEALTANNESEIINKRICKTQNGDNEVTPMRISLATGKVSILADNATDITWISPDRRWLALATSTGATLFYNVDGAKALPMPIDPRQGEANGTQDGSKNIALELRDMRITMLDQFLYGFGGTGEEPKMYRFDSKSGQSQEVCGEAVGQKLLIGKLSDSKLFLFTYDKTLSVFRFYQVKSANECVRINEFPSQFSYVHQLTPTSIGFGLLVGTKVSATSNAWSREAIFVPVDGRPPMKFNSDTNHNWSMGVSPDQNRIYLSGPNAANAERVFSFDLK